MAANNGSIKLVAGNSNRALSEAVGAYLQTPLAKVVANLIEREPVHRRVFGVVRELGSRCHRESFITAWRRGT